MTAPFPSRFLAGAAAISVATPFWAFFLGTRDAGRYPLVWILPIVPGLIAIGLAVLVFRQAYASRSWRSFWFGVCATLLGLACPVAGWWALGLGEIVLHGWP